MPSLIPTMILLPLVGAFLNGLVLRPPYPRRAGVIGTAFAAGSFACAVALWLRLLSTGEGMIWSVPWFQAGGFHADWSFVFDAFTAMMALVVTGIGTLIHLYSIGYMSEDRTPSRYFAYLNLFLFAMLTLISGSNLIVLFVGWEGVGLCSYLLIGYWFQDEDKAKAGMKAFLLNRIGDAGFLVGIFLCYEMFHSVSFSEMAQAMGSPDAMQRFDMTKLNLAALCLFIGAMGKSAQIPLYVWLPDAMAGPTPVSALIHAATMVTAGIYLVTRMSFLFLVAHDTSLFVAAIGAATALMAALIALGQRDIKKVLAYSTVSQLGLMFLALGCGAYLAAVFHLMTHAFFKALLFLGAGSVIHGLHGEQDIFKMGGLKKEMPVTFWTFLIGTVAIAGVPPLAGFFSKDLILYSALNAPHGFVFWAVGSFASFLTAFYMTRLFVLTFLGRYRGHAHAHESPATMTIPLIALAIGSIFAGFLEMPHDLHLIPPVLSHFLHGALPTAEHGAAMGPLSEFAAMGIATALALLAIALGYWTYTRPGVEEKGVAAILGNVVRPFARVLENKFYVDEIYGLLFVRPFEWISMFLARFFDGRVIDAAVIFPSRVARAGATVLSFVQWGSAQFYMLVMLLGGLAILWFSLKGMVL